LGQCREWLTRWALLGVQCLDRLPLVVILLADMQAR